MSMEELLRERADIWRCRAFPARPQDLPSTGFPALDARLEGGGWPTGVIEILGAGSGRDAVQLILPAMAERGAAHTALTLLVSPPHPPYAPGFAACGVDPGALQWLQPGTEPEALWALEVAARSGACNTLAGWIKRCEPTDVRRLQLAAQQGSSRCFLFRPLQTALTPSPATLRLRAQRRGGELVVDLLKRRGGFPIHDLHLAPPPLPPSATTQATQPGVGH